MGTHPSAKREQECLKRFEELYGDEIELESEELPSDFAYSDKMKNYRFADILTTRIE